MPQIAIISDIHANIDALDAVLREIEDLGITSVICLGDIVGYGAAPAECLDRVRESCSTVVIGNHDVFLTNWKVFRGEFGETGTVGAGIALANCTLSPAQKKWLRARPLTAAVHGLEMVHASLSSPAEFDYIFTDKGVRENFAAQKGFISFHGHTHIPLIWEEAERRKINIYAPADSALTRLDSRFRYAIGVGSVGQPRDRDPRACFVIYDSDNARILFRRVEYDIRAAQKRMKAAGMPDRNWERIEEGA